MKIKRIKTDTRIGLAVKLLRVELCFTFQRHVEPVNMQELHEELHKQLQIEQNNYGNE